jgi:hypothetical protein
MLTKQQIQTLKLEYATTPVGTTLPKSVCPVCNGGTSREKSFSVTVDPSGILFNCHRSSCEGGRGIIATGTSVVGADRIKPELRIFKHPTEGLTDYDLSQFSRRYGITSQELIDNNVVQCPSRGSIVYPIYNFMGYEIGKQERWYSWSKRRPFERKALYYREMDYPTLYVPRTSPLTDRLYVVEDTLSAIKISRLYTACALLGTSLNNELLLLFKEAKIKELVLLLDPDAFTKSIRIKREYSLYFDEIRIVQLPDDPKDMNFDDLQEMLDE